MRQIITIQHCQSEHHVNGMMGGGKRRGLGGMFGKMKLPF